jgi:hypothetical protein
MNPDGYSSAFSPDDGGKSWWYVDPYLAGIDHLPIFNYYQGKYSAGESLGSVNGYKHYWSNENRHMFEVNETVTRTYIIRPPSDGPIQTSYVVYAHWFEPAVYPVTNPAEDFPPQANSPSPYEFWITQDEPIDPDQDGFDQSKHIHWHIKTWDIVVKEWKGSQTDVMYQLNWGGNVFPHPSGIEDEYWMKDFNSYPYSELPNAFPGSYPYLYGLSVFGVEEPNSIPIGREYYIAYIDIAESDGE